VPAQCKETVLVPIVLIVLVEVLEAINVAYGSITRRVARMYLGLRRSTSKSCSIREPITAFVGIDPSQARFTREQRRNGGAGSCGGPTTLLSLLRLLSEALHDHFICVHPLLGLTVSENSPEPYDSHQPTPITTVVTSL